MYRCSIGSCAWQRVPQTVNVAFSYSQEGFLPWRICVFLVTTVICDRGPRKLLFSTMTRKYSLIFGREVGFLNWHFWVPHPRHITISGKLGGLSRGHFGGHLGPRWTIISSNFGVPVYLSKITLIKDHWNQRSHTEKKVQDKHLTLQKVLNNLIFLAWLPLWISLSVLPQ